jgi:hypothetical protein
MTTDTVKKLGQMELTGGTDTVYTVPGVTSTLVKHMSIVNTSTVSGSTVRLWHDGSSNVNLIMPAITIAAGEWAEFEGTITMETGDTLKAEAQIGNVITITVHGVEFTA